MSNFKVTVTFTIKRSSTCPPQGKRIKIGYEKRLAPSFLRGHSDAGGIRPGKSEPSGCAPGQILHYVQNDSPG